MSVMNQSVQEIERKCKRENKLNILRYRNLNTFAEGHFLKKPLFVMRRA